MPELNEAVIISAARTPVGKFLGSLKGFSATELGAIVVRKSYFTAGQARRRTDDRNQRGAQVVRDRRQQCRAQPLRLGQKPRILDVAGEVRALDRHRHLIGYGLEEAALLVRQRPRRPFERHGKQPDRAAPRPKRQEEPFRRRQGVRTPPRWLAVLPGPLRRAPRR